MSSELPPDIAPPLELEAIERFIHEGISLDLETIPEAADLPNTPSVHTEAAAVRARLQDYMSIGAVELMDSRVVPPHGIQPLHVIIKEKKKPRLVIDLSRNLNDHLRYEYFSYSSIDNGVEAAWPGCWFGKLDLSNCFLSFPLHPDFYKFFYFRFENKLYRFVRMPFGLAPAPRICTQLLSVPSFALTQAGCRHVRYLDDFLFIAHSKDELEETLRKAQAIFASLGLVVNAEKTEGPLQRISFLGVLIDSVECVTACTEERLRELRKLLVQASQPNTLIRRGQLESLVGKLSFAAKVLPGARPFMRSMYDAMNHCKHRHTLVRLSPLFRTDVRFWLDHLHQWNVKQQWRQTRSDPIVLTTDASLNGFGFHLTKTPTHVDATRWPTHMQLGSGFCGSYHASHSHLHQSPTQIGWCEMLAVLAALQTYSHVLRNECVRIEIDNSGDMAILNRQSTRSIIIATLLRQIYTLSLQFNFSIKAVHRPGVDNVLADFLSRPEFHRNDPLTFAALKVPSVASGLRSCTFVNSMSFAPNS